MKPLEQILVALSQLANALLGGYADESISARAHRCKWRVREQLINALFFDPLHCAHAYQNERVRAQLPPEYRA